MVIIIVFSDRLANGIFANVRRYVEYSPPTIEGVGDAFAPHFAWF